MKILLITCTSKAKTEELITDFLKDFPLCVLYCDNSLNKTFLCPECTGMGQISIYPFLNRYARCLRQCIRRPVLFITTDEEKAIINVSKFKREHNWQRRRSLNDLDTAFTSCSIPWKEFQSLPK